MNLELTCIRDGQPATWYEPWTNLYRRWSACDKWIWIFSASSGPSTSQSRDRLLKGNWASWIFSKLEYLDFIGPINRQQKHKIKPKMLIFFCLFGCNFFFYSFLVLLLLFGYKILSQELKLAASRNSSLSPHDWLEQDGDSDVRKTDASFLKHSTYTYFLGPPIKFLR